MANNPLRAKIKKGRKGSVTRMTFLSFSVLLFFAFLTGRLPGTSGTEDAQTQVARDRQPRWEYVPNQLLVKFRSQTAPVSEATFEIGQTEVDVTEALDRLNQRFPLRRSERLFPGFSKYQRKMEVLPKKSSGQLTKLEKRLLPRRQS